MATWDDLPDDLIKAIMSMRTRLLLQDAMARHARKDCEKKQRNLCLAYDHIEWLGLDEDDPAWI